MRTLGYNRASYFGYTTAVSSYYVQNVNWLWRFLFNASAPFPFTGLHKGAAVRNQNAELDWIGRAGAYKVEFHPEPPGPAPG